MLKQMKRYSLPIPSFSNEALIDDEGVFGYRMELLSPSDFSDFSAVSDILKAIVNRVHECGLSHGDLNPSNPSNPSNVMRNSSGSHAGDSEIRPPPRIPVPRGNCFL